MDQVPQIVCRTSKTKVNNSWQELSDFTHSIIPSLIPTQVSKMSRVSSDEYIKQHQALWRKFYQHVNETKQESAWKRDARYAALTMGTSAERTADIYKEIQELDLAEMEKLEKIKREHCFAVAALGANIGELTGKGVKLTAGEGGGKNATDATGQEKGPNKSFNVNSNYKHLWVDADKTANVKQNNKHDNKDKEAGTGEEKPTKSTQSCIANRNYKHLWVDTNETANVESGNKNSNTVIKAGADQNKPVTKNMLAARNYKHLWVDTEATANVKQDNNHSNKGIWAGTGPEQPAPQGFRARNFKHLWVNANKTAQAENEASQKVSEPGAQVEKASNKRFTASRNFKHLWIDTEATGKVMQGNRGINKDSELETQLEKAASKTSSDLGHDMFAVFKPCLSPGPKTSMLKPLTSVYSPASPSSESSWSAYTYRGPNTRPATPDWTTTTDAPAGPFLREAYTTATHWAPKATLTNNKLQNDGGPSTAPSNKQAPHEALFELLGLYYENLTSPTTALIRHPANAEQELEELFMSSTADSVLLGLSDALIEMIEDKYERLIAPYK